VRDANGTVIGTGVVGANGTFLIDLNPAAQPGEHLSLVQTDPSGNASVALEYDVPLTTAPTARAIWPSMPTAPPSPVPRRLAAAWKCMPTAR
jgi:hypothetical protein